MKFKEYFSKLIRLGALFLFPFLVGSIGFATDIPLTFKLNAHPSAVAIQFDVSQDGASGLLPSPIFNGASPHTVESAVLSSGATRFVVYSTTGLPISASGEVTVSFEAPALGNGILSVSGMIASDASGVLTSAAPNSQPILTSATMPSHSSQQLGLSREFSVTAYDLDGSVSSVSFAEDGATFAFAADFDPSLATWTPASIGLKEISATATDSAGAATTSSLGPVRVYELSELTSFEAFESIHFGTAANPADLGFETIAFNSGIPNGLAWMLGVNPHAPDRSKLPDLSIESGETVFRFNYLAGLSGLDWKVYETDNLESASWSSVPGSDISETPVGDGTIDIEVRRTIDPQVNPRAFMTLEATQNL